MARKWQKLSLIIKIATVGWSSIVPKFNNLTINSVPVRIYDKVLACLNREW